MPGENALTTASTNTTSACTREFLITAPRNRTKISAIAGVEMSGAACPEDLVWLLDFDPPTEPTTA